MPRANFVRRVAAAFYVFLKGRDLMISEHQIARVAARKFRVSQLRPRQHCGPCGPSRHGPSCLLDHAAPSKLCSLAVDPPALQAARVCVLSDTELLSQARLQRACKAQNTGRAFFAESHGLKEWSHKLLLGTDGLCLFIFPVLMCRAEVRAPCFGCFLRIRGCAEAWLAHKLLPCAACAESAAASML